MTRLEGQEVNPEFREKHERQVEILKKISALFNNAGVRWWLTGGFALEANLGEESISRVHGDIDVIVPNTDIEKAERLLFDAGFRLERQERFKLNVFAGDEQVMDILNYRFTEDGSAVLETKDEIGRDIIYPSVAFDIRQRTYFGAQVFTVFPELIYLQQKNSRDPQERHKADMLLLEKIINRDRLEQINNSKPYLTDEDMVFYDKKKVVADKIE